MAYPMHHQLNAGGGGGGDGCAHKQEVETFVATAGQTSFTLTNPASGDVIFARNGATLDDGNATVSGSTVTYSGIALLAGDRVSISYVWVDCSEPANPLNLDWHITGNAGTDDAVNFIGTTDAKDFVTKTNNIERMRVLASNGFIGIGTNAPTDDVHVKKSVAGGVSVLLENTNVTASGYASYGVQNGSVLAGIGAYSAGGFAYEGTSSAHDFRIQAGNVTVMNYANATKFVAVGDFVPLSKLDVGGSFGYAITVSAAAVALGATHHTVVLTGAAVTQALPTAVARREYVIKNGGSGTVTVTGHIDGNASGSVTLAAGQALTAQSNGTTWYSLCCENKALPLTYELKRSGTPPVGEQVNQNTEITAVTGSITMVNGTSQPKRFFETAALVEVAVNNIGFAGSPRLGARLQRSTNGGSTWDNHSTGGANPWIPVPNGTQQEVSGGQGSYFHTVAANSSLTVNYRALRVIEATAVGGAVSVNFAALEAMIMELR